MENKKLVDKKAVASDRGSRKKLRDDGRDLYVFHQQVDDPRAEAKVKEKKEEILCDLTANALRSPVLECPELLQSEAYGKPCEKARDRCGKIPYPHSKKDIHKREIHCGRGRSRNQKACDVGGVIPHKTHSHFSGFAFRRGHGSKE